MINLTKLNEKNALIVTVMMKKKNENHLKHKHRKLMEQTKKKMNLIALVKISQSLINISIGKQRSSSPSLISQTVQSEISLSLK